MLSDSKKRANAKYNSKCDQIMLKPLKEDGNKIRQAAEKSGKSLQKYCLDILLEYIDNHASDTI